MKKLVLRETTLLVHVYSLPQPVLLRVRVRMRVRVGTRLRARVRTLPRTLTFYP